MKTVYVAIIYVIILLVLSSFNAYAEDIIAITPNDYVYVLNENVVYKGILVVIPKIHSMTLSWDRSYLIVYGDHDIHVFTTHPVYLLWSRHVESKIVSIASYDDKVYVGTTNGYIVFSAKNGSIVKSVFTGVETIVGYRTIVYILNNTVYMIVNNNNIVVPLETPSYIVSVGYDPETRIWWLVLNTNDTGSVVYVNNTSINLYSKSLMTERCWNLLCVVTEDSVVAINYTVRDIVWMIGIPHEVYDVCGGKMFWLATATGLIGLLPSGKIGYYQPGNFTAVSCFEGYVYALTSDGRVYSDYAPSQRNLYVVKVVDKYGNPVPNALVEIAGYKAHTNESGVAVLRVPDENDTGVIRVQMGKYFGEKTVAKHYYVRTTVVLSKLVYGQLVVDVEPVEARVNTRIRVVGKDYNTIIKPGEIVSLPVGDYTLIVSAPGYEEKKINITITRGENRVRVKLNKFEYDVYIVVFKQQLPFMGYARGSAKLYIDGVFVGRVSSIHVKLEAGKHVVTAKDNYYMEKTVVVSVGKNGTTVELYLDYEPAMQALFVAVIVSLLVIASYGLKILVFHIISWLKERREIILE